MVSGIKNVTPSEQGGVVSDPEYKYFAADEVCKSTTGARSSPSTVVFVPAWVIAGSPATTVSIKVRPGPSDNSKRTVKTRKVEEPSEISQAPEKGGP